MVLAVPLYAMLQRVGLAAAAVVLDSVLAGVSGSKSAAQFSQPLEAFTLTRSAGTRRKCTMNSRTGAQLASVGCGIPGFFFR